MISKKVSDTESLAQKIAKEIKSGNQKDKVLVFALAGDLGSGKTTFVRAFLKALGVRGQITSPTFVLIKSYEISDQILPAGRQVRNDKRSQNGIKKIYHMDLYRIEKLSELEALGFKDILNPPVSGGNAIILIEWADKIKKAIPKDATWIYFKHSKSKNERIVTVKR